MLFLILCALPVFIYGILWESILYLLVRASIIKPRTPKKIFKLIFQNVNNTSETGNLPK